ncbi:acetyltransferase [Methylocaldum szegediense]|jgi:UDP-perosamine 4-acetyltransferase|uniref:PglD_N domain-containing protein n=1 Tax=Methylocaldum szegediense TaxID=73780 RepID=A0ABM9I829_9GAMM|nr:acetyltransferase [Methylocaldum szegediense]CAI8952787.1 PglD_N domain-containing protein [Methylocaldum szegediense]
MTDKSLILLGGGGHATVLWEVLSLTECDVLGFVDPRPREDSVLALHARYLGDDGTVLLHDPQRVALINGIGSTASTQARRAIYQRFTAQGYEFAELVHPGALVSRLDTLFGMGVQVLAGAVIGPAVRFGDNVLINSRALVEHDCEVGAHCHVASGAVLCGGVRLGQGVHVGAGATIIQGVTVGDGAIIAAGSAVIKDVPATTLVAGVPARIKRTLDR